MTWSLINRSIWEKESINPERPLISKFVGNPSCLDRSPIKFSDGDPLVHEWHKYFDDIFKAYICSLRTIQIFHNKLRILFTESNSKNHLQATNTICKPSFHRGMVSPHCRHALQTCTANMHCWHASQTCIADMHCRHALLYPLLLITNTREISASKSAEHRLRRESAKSRVWISKILESHWLWWHFSSFPVSSHHFKRKVAIFAISSTLNQWENWD